MSSRLSSGESSSVGESSSAVSIESSPRDRDGHGRLTNELDVFERISLSVVDFLKNHPGVRDVNLCERPGALEEDFDAWQKKNTPFRLPQDLKSFYLVSDGMLIRWNMKYQGEALPLGCIHVNAIAQVSRLPLLHEEIVLKSCCGSLPLENPISPMFRRKAFDLDAMCLDGKVILLYDHDYSEPSIWFQDLSCQLFFVARTFTDYIRLLIMHLGLPHWQYAFSDVGIPNITKQWFRFMSPERLSIDIKYMESKPASQTTKHSNDRQKLNFSRIEKLAKMASTRPTKTKKKSQDEMSDYSSGKRFQRPASARSTRVEAPTKPQNLSLSDRRRSRTQKLKRPETASRYP